MLLMRYNNLSGIVICLLLTMAVMVMVARRIPNVQAREGASNSTFVPAQNFEAYRIVINNNRVYTLTFGGRIDIYDITDPLYPQLLGYVSTPELGTSDFDVSGNYLYMFDYQWATFDSGFAGVIHIYDVSDATNPVLKAKFNGWRFGEPYTIRTDRQYLHLWHVLDSYEPSAIEIYDISDMSLAKYISSYDTGAYNLQIVDERSYLPESGGINIYDISDAFDPKAIGTNALLEITQGVTNFTVSEHVLYLTSVVTEADGSEKCGIRIIDIENLDAPELVGTMEIENLCYVPPVVQGERLYVSVLQRGDPLNPGSSSYDIVVFDVSDPASIKEWARYKPPPPDRMSLHFAVSEPCMYITGTSDNSLVTICMTQAPQGTVTPTPSYPQFMPLLRLD